MRVGKHEIDISNRDKTLFPDTGLTKGDLIDYYQQVADIFLSHSQKYCVSQQRFPDGLSEEGFYQKDAPDYYPDWIRTVDFPKREGGFFRAPVIDSKATLLYLVNQAMITPHFYLSRMDELEQPDKMIFDLDPPLSSQDDKAVADAAKDIRDTLKELDLTPWVQTTGSTGFHVVVPIRRKAGFERVRHFARNVALLMVRRRPDRYTLILQKRERKGRIFLDTIRNAYGATAVAPYAVRALPGGPVATPLDWRELKHGASPRYWTIKNLPHRLAQKPDPWSRLMHHAYQFETRESLLQQLIDREKPADEESRD